MRLHFGKNQFNPSQIALDPTIEAIHAKIAKYFEERKCHFTTETLDFPCFQLTDDKGRLVDLYSMVDVAKTYDFSLPTKITVESASCWTYEKLEQLYIVFKDVKNLQKELPMLDKVMLASIDQEVSKLAVGLSEVNHTLVTQFKAYDLMSDDELTKLSPLLKSILMATKYTRIEAAVDSMVSNLLIHCGFSSERLYAFARFPFKIYFGNSTADAIPDFTIFDLKSYYRMAVVEDKYSGNSVLDVNVEAQLIAEAIAMAQANVLDCNDEEGIDTPRKRSKINDGFDSVLGIMVRGTKFSFYVIPISQTILEGMRTCRSVQDSTIVSRRCNLDLIVEVERLEILKLLCSFRKVIEIEGIESKRRQWNCR